MKSCPKSKYHCMHEKKEEATFKHGPYHPTEEKREFKIYICCHCGHPISEEDYRSEVGFHG